MNERLYYYDGDWRSISDLYDNYGITLYPSTSIYVYDYNLNRYAAWADRDNNIWVVRDNQWYTPDDLTYWLKQDRKFTNAYLISNQLNLDVYTFHGNEMYEYNGCLQSFQNMHLSFGVTHTPSSIYFIKDTIIKCWYNKDIDQYWDVDTCHWYNNPPDYSDYSGDINTIGATGLFSYYSENGSATHYGTLVTGDRLTPISISFPDSGDLSYTKLHSIQLTGTWKILTETIGSSESKPCIVFATKISNEDHNDLLESVAQLLSSATSNNSVQQVEDIITEEGNRLEDDSHDSATEFISYDL
jgi:hypothetical protein